MKTFLTSKIAILLLCTIAAIGCSTAGIANQNSSANNSAEAQPTPTAGQGEAAAGSAQTSPNALVADLYKQHDAKKGPFFQDKDRALVDKYFTKALGDMIWNDAVQSRKDQGVGALDFDPMYDGQDFEIKNFKVGAADLKGDKATVVASFHNFGKPQTVKFLMVNEKNAWKISDVDYGSKMTLTGVFKGNFESKVDSPTEGFFEGKYQVGDTTCTVKAVKMGFEVKWVKGSGVEMFFPSGDGSYNFASEKDAKGGENVFFFDDDNYDTGMFRRADGKEFPVKRSK